MQFNGNEFHSLDSSSHTPKKDKPWDAGRVTKEPPGAIQ